ncbi:MAG: DUF2279 domain-containing protein [Bacteroidota bacterium]
MIGQTHAQDSTNINPAKAAIILGVMTGIVTAVHIYQREAWWQGERQPFRFENDWTYALNIDKCGHIYGAYTESKLAHSILSWTGFSEKSSLFYGSLIGLSYQMYVEVEDGYHKDYGFSPGDAISNIMGASIPLAQNQFPILQNFSLKYSYHPSDQYLNDLRSEKFRTFIDDYEGTIFWVSMDPHFLLSYNAAKAVPSWLGISFGLAAHNLNELGGGDRLYYLTLDYNFSKIETQSSILHDFLCALDYFHLPAPGIGLEDGKLKFGIFYTYHIKTEL